MEEIVMSCEDMREVLWDLEQILKRCEEAEIEMVSRALRQVHRSIDDLCSGRIRGYRNISLE